MKKLILSVIIDEETRSDIREIILDQARGIARSVMDQTIVKEVERLMNTSFMNKIAASSDVRFQQVMRDAITSRWSEVNEKITQAVTVAIEAAAIKVVEQKLKDKTVWQASTQKNMIASIAQTEAAKVYRKMKEAELLNARVDAEIKKEDDDD